MTDPDLTQIEQATGARLEAYRSIMPKLGPGHHRLGRQETRDATEELLALIMRLVGEIAAMKSERIDTGIGLSEQLLKATERCGDCKRYDVTSFCSRWERCSHPDDFCSYFTDRKEQAEAEQSRLAAMTKERDDLLRTMREGGCRDCDDLAKERDSLYDIVKEYGAGNGALKDENAGLTDRIRDLERELAMEEEEARRWEWVATHYRGWDFTGPDKVGDRREQSVRNSGDDEVEWLLARYQPSDREGE